ENGVCSTGLAVLRRDGLASMEAGDVSGTLTTRPLRFSGAYLFVNAALPLGELRIEILSRDGRVLEPFSREACVPIAEDGTKQRVTWHQADRLDSVQGRVVRLRFAMTRGQLFSFWVSDSSTGSSGGYSAAGHASGA